MTPKEPFCLTCNSSFVLVWCGGLEQHSLQLFWSVRCLVDIPNPHDVHFRSCLVAHTCCDPSRATQCRAHSVAADSRSFTGVAGVSRYTPLKDCVTPVFPPPVAVVFGVFCREWGGGRTGSARSVARECPSENGSRYTGV